MQETVQELHDSQQIAEHVARYLLSASQYPVFGTGGVPVEVAARVYGKDATWVRQGIEDGWLPIGYMTKSGAKRNFYISPKKLWEDTGYIWKGGDRSAEILHEPR